MGCIASKKPQSGGIELTEAELEVKETENVIGLTKRQRFYYSSLNQTIFRFKYLETWTLGWVKWILKGNNNSFSFKDIDDPLTPRTRKPWLERK